MNDVAAARRGVPQSPDEVCRRKMENSIKPKLISGQSCVKPSVTFRLQTSVGITFLESGRESFRRLELMTIPSLYETVLYCRYKCKTSRGRDVHGYNTRGRVVLRVAQHRLRAQEALPREVIAILVGGGDFYGVDEFADREPLLRVASKFTRSDAMRFLPVRITKDRAYSYDSMLPDDDRFKEYN
ncbi:hypothetical protein J6590_085418 [Homalodisca vitripennis]|nr:hypothetical protein J6590_085418 [Homalodisca vitripennis]